MATKPAASSFSKKQYDLPNRGVDGGFIIPINSTNAQTTEELVELETKLTFEPDFAREPIAFTNNQLDGAEVLDFLRSNNYTDALCEFNTRHSKPDKQPLLTTQVTRESLIKDGQDIVNYLRLQRYATDMNGEEYDLCQQFEEVSGSDFAALEKAVKRLRLFKAHISRESSK